MFRGKRPRLCILGVLHFALARASTEVQGSPCPDCLLVVLGVLGLDQWLRVPCAFSILRKQLFSTPSPPSSGFLKVRGQACAWWVNSARQRSPCGYMHSYSIGQLCILLTRLHLMPSKLLLTTLLISSCRGLRHGALPSFRSHACCRFNFVASSLFKCRHRCRSVSLFKLPNWLPARATLHSYFGEGCLFCIMITCLRVSLDTSFVFCPGSKPSPCCFPVRARLCLILRSSGAFGFSLLI